MSQHTAPAEDFIDVTTAMFVGGYDIETIHGRMARHATVIDIGAGTQLLVAVTGAGNTRTATCVTNGEQFPVFIASFTAASTVARVRIFFDNTP
jgi:hypothetical protein